MTIARLSLAALLAATLAVPAMAQVQPSVTTPAATTQPAAPAKPATTRHTIVRARKATPAAVKTAQPAPAATSTMTH